MNLKEILRENNIEYGYNQVKKGIIKGKYKLVILASEAPKEIKEDIENLCEQFGTSLEIFEGTTRQLGTDCGKPFPISVLGVLKK